MKRRILLIMMLLLFPTIVIAKDNCNNNDITIKDITTENIEGYIEEMSEPSIDNNQINLNIEMYNVGESITYKIKVKNNSNNDYYFTKDSFNLNTDYIEYSLLNSSEVIKANEEKSIQLKITYKEKIPEDEFNENNRMSITLSDTPLANPSTKRALILLISVIFITLAVIFVSKNKKLNKVLIGLILCFIPLSIKALCIVDLEINANITINEKEAIFLPGQEVNVKMKLLAGDDTSSAYMPYYFEDENIIFIKYSEIAPTNINKEEKNIVSTTSSPYPIYMWYEEGTIYWWSEDKHPNINENASDMFSYLKKLNNISELGRFDTSNTKNMWYMFRGTISLTSLEGLENWNTSNVTTMYGIFMNIPLVSAEPLRNWNTSSLTDMSSMFLLTKLISVEPLRNWDTSNVTSLMQTFMYTDIDDLEPLKDWNTSQIKSLFSTFAGTKITSLEPLRNWNTSNVTTVDQLFVSTKITNLDPLKDWDTSNLKSMSRTFQDIKTLTDISGISNWNVSNVRKFINTFAFSSSLTDASAINDWDIQSTADFYEMFSSVPTHPEFSKVPGTWNSRGTFTPAP